MTLDPIEARSLFPITEKVIYLQHAGSAPLSTRSRDAVERVAKLSAEAPDWGKSYAKEWEGLRKSLASLVSVKPEEITLTRGTAQGLSLLRGLDWKDGDNVVSIRGEYPANTFPWTTLAHRGVQLKLIDPVDGKVTPEAIFEAFDERTRVLSISWIQFTNGYRYDIERIGAECRKRGIVFALDAIQGVGTIPIDAPAMNVDLLACGATKWLMGPPGAGFCYVRSELLDSLVPPFVGVGTMAMDPSIPFEDHKDFRPSAARFEESGVSWFDIAAFQAAVDLMNEVTLEVIEERVLHLSKYIGERLAGLGFQIVPPWPKSREESSGIVSIYPVTPADETVKMLREAGIVARLFRKLVRFSTHFYNTEEELDTVLDFLDKKIER
jgi:cysteine desulfurase/selenocysteine lyase